MLQTISKLLFGFRIGGDAVSRKSTPSVEFAAPIRVLHISRVGFVGGTERIILTLTSGLKDHGYDPIIAGPAGGPLERHVRASGVDFAPMAFDRLRVTLNPRVFLRYPYSWWSRSRCLLRYCQKQNIKIIHAHHPVGALYARLAIRKLQITLILHMHDGPPTSFFYRFLLRRAILDASTVVCVSGAARGILQSLGDNVPTAELVYNAVDATFYDADASPAKDVVGSGPHIGIFGVLEPRKGQDEFLKAAIIIARAIPNAHFWIVGPLALKDKSKYKNQLDILANNPILNGKVTFTGHRDDIPSVMKSMNIVVSASVSHESFGMVLAEAMALGCPVVTTAVGGTIEVVNNGTTGRVVPCRDSSALAAAIIDVLESDSSLMVAAAHAEVRARFSPAIFRQRIAGIYDSSLQIRRRAS